MIKDRYLNSNYHHDRLVIEYEKHGSLFIAFDFDHTIYDYDQVGDTYPAMINIIKEAQEVGLKLILFTCREGEALEFAVEHCKSLGIVPDYINESPITQTRKPYYSLLLDDRAGLFQSYMFLYSIIGIIKNKKNGITTE